MSTQSYYKDRLGFDPREALYDGPVKSSRGHSQNSHYVSNNNGSSDHYATPSKKHKQQHQASYQQQQDQTPQGGYEDALTQFKGSMSVWEYFVENSDKLGMSVECVNRKKKYKRCMVLLKQPNNSLYAYLLKKFVEAKVDTKKSQVA
jgi:hypothetical protein